MAPACPLPLTVVASRHECAAGPFVNLAPSPNGKFVAALTSGGTLLVLASGLLAALGVKCCDDAWNRALSSISLSMRLQK